MTLSQRKPIFSSEVSPPSNQASVALFIAFRMADRYGKRIPTSRELRDEWGMHKSTACRYIRAMKDARGLP